MNPKNYIEKAINGPQQEGENYNQFIDITQVPEKMKQIIKCKECGCELFETGRYTKTYKLLTNPVKYAASEIKTCKDCGWEMPLLP